MAKLRVNSPCQHCKSRYLGCHDECVDYGKYKNKKDEINEALNSGKAKESLINEYEVKRIRRR